MKPNKVNIRKWVKALRSGKYRQTRGKLHGQFGHCCLGVAVEICPVKDVEQFDEVLPEEVMNWLGVPEVNPELRLKSGKEVSATAMNDTSHYSFNEIADAIERTYLKK